MVKHQQKKKKNMMMMMMMMIVDDCNLLQSEIYITYPRMCVASFLSQDEDKPNPAVVRN
jgi:hypothetical protein